MLKRIRIDDAIGGFRTELMALSIIWVMLLHGMELYPSINIPIVTLVCKMGNIGVDIFLLLSGYGLYFSMVHNSDKMVFYKKRAKKVLFPFMLLTVPYWIVVTILQKGTTLSFFENVVGISFFTKGIVTFWYAIFILILYAVYPILFNFIQKGKAPQIVASIILANLLGFLFFPEIYENIEIATTRIVIFIIGSTIAKLHFSDENSRKKPMVLFAVYSIVFSLLFLSSPIIKIYNNDFAVMAYRYGSGGIALVISGIVSCFGFIKKWKILSVIGQVTLEIYLIHIILRKILVAIGLNEVKAPLVMLSIWILTMLLSVWLSIGYSKLYNRLVK